MATPEEDRDFVRKLLDRIQLAALDLNIKLRAAGMMGLEVPVDTAERDGWTEVIVHTPEEGEPE